MNQQKLLIQFNGIFVIYLSNAFQYARLIYKRLFNIESIAQARLFSARFSCFCIAQVFIDRRSFLGLSYRFSLSYIFGSFFLSFWKWYCVQWKLIQSYYTYFHLITRINFNRIFILSNRILKKIKGIIYKIQFNWIKYRDHQFSRSLTQAHTVDFFDLNELRCPIYYWSW